MSEKLDDYINETHKLVIIAGYKFNPADIIKKLDPIAYREMLKVFEIEDD